MFLTCAGVEAEVEDKGLVFGSGEGGGYARGCFCGSPDMMRRTYIRIVKGQDRTATTLLIDSKLQGLLRTRYVRRIAKNGEYGDDMVNRHKG